ncbi:MAG: M23 family metallopeptidase [Dehalococcoidia bacterium]|nr:M23 family metallopeptidase [Dehalococcoidia bacterium]
MQAILGTTQPQLLVRAAEEVAVFGGRGPGGVLTPPLERVLDRRATGSLLNLLAAAGSTVRAPADGRVDSVRDRDGLGTLALDHGNGWESSLSGLAGVLALAGQQVRRGNALGTLAEGLTPGQGVLGLSLNGWMLPASRYVLLS